MSVLSRGSFWGSFGHSTHGLTAAVLMRMRIFFTLRSGITFFTLFSCQRGQPFAFRSLKTVALCNFIGRPAVCSGSSDKRGQPIGQGTGIAVFLRQFIRYARFGVVAAVIPFLLFQIPVVGGFLAFLAAGAAWWGRMWLKMRRTPSEYPDTKGIQQKFRKTTQRFVLGFFGIGS